MIPTHLTVRAAALAAAATLAFSLAVRAAEPAPDVQSEITALKARIAELEKKENENWLSEERATQIKSLVQEVLADAKARGQFADNDLQAGYENGFFIRTADKKFNLVFNGFTQFRYVYGSYNKKNVSTASNASDPGDANGFELRRSRFSLSGNAFSPDLFFKFEGDFAGKSTDNGSFEVTDAYIGYKLNPWLSFRAGSYKVPFAKTELVSDTALGLMERPEVLFPFDPQRAIGAGVFGDIIKDQLSYEFMAMNGSNGNKLGRITDNGSSGALDNRLGFYGRTQYAGAGKIADFASEPDLRDPAKGRDFIWMAGLAAGYESQNATSTAFPHAQTTPNLPGLSTENSPGFLANQNLNGDLFRLTGDWSAKWNGWEAITSIYYQQVNENPGPGFTAPYANKSSFFQLGYYGQIGYMIIPQKLELVGRIGELQTDSLPNHAEYYTLGANYYLFGNNAKLQADVNYAPEAAFTDASSDQILNTHQLLYRVQLQLKF